MVSGIGGTGVVTIGALLGMAAHLEGLACSVFDMTGLSQKNGAVYSHVRIAAVASDLAAQKLGTGEADLARRHSYRARRIEGKAGADSRKRNGPCRPNIASMQLTATADRQERRHDGETCVTTGKNRR